MRLVDSHCHLNLLDLDAYQGNLTQLIEETEKQGVVHFLCVCINLKDFPKVLEIAKAYSQVSASLGLHPNEEVEQEPNIDDLVNLATDKNVVAIGETGLDYYRSTGELEWQRQRFRQHIRAAKLLRKPLIIHTRQAREDTIQILKEERADEVGGVMHCFTEDWHTAQQALDLNFYISFSGIVTFRNAVEIQEVAKRVPLDRMLIETDSPYLAPAPYRGKPNQPAYVKLVAEQLAQLRGVNSVELAEQTTQNFFKLFKVSL